MNKKKFLDILAYLILFLVFTGLCILVVIDNGNPAWWAFLYTGGFASFGWAFYRIINNWIYG